jgi:hypothetical protein
MRGSVIARHRIEMPNLLRRPALGGRAGGAAASWLWLFRLLIALLLILWLLGVMWVVPVY